MLHQRAVVHQLKFVWFQDHCSAIEPSYNTVFAGVKAAVFSGEKKSKSRGAAYTQQQQNSAVKTSRPFERMGIYER